MKQSFVKAVLVGAALIAAGGVANAVTAQDQPSAASPAAPAVADAALVEKTCTACHVAAQFTSQRRSRDQWADTVSTMVGYGAQVTDAEFDPIVNYLAKNYGTDPQTPAAK